MNAVVIGRHTRNIGKTSVVAGLIAACGIGAALIAEMTTPTRAAGGQSFTSLDSSYTQELIGTTQLPAFPDGLPVVLGGIAFAPGGDLWVADCVFTGTRLHRFARHNKDAWTPESNRPFTMFDN